MKDMEISKVLYLARNKKYEVAVAAFDAVDHIYKVDVPRSLRSRKLAVQAMSLISDSQLKYGYDNPEGTEGVADSASSSEEE